MVENDKWWTNAKWEWGMTDNGKWPTVGKNIIGTDGHLDLTQFRMSDIKVEYHANENPLKNSEKISICWSKLNVSNNQNKIIAYHIRLFVKMPLSFRVLH